METQTRAPQLRRTSRNTNPHVSTSTGVIHKTSVSRPQLKSTQMKDKVVQNNSQVKLKKTEVEDHHRISSFSNNKTKSVTVCNDSLKSKTLNVNAVCATCGKCVFNSNHDACVSKFINDVNARTKKPKVVPIRSNLSNVHRPLILLQIVQLILFIVDSRCTKHMMGNLKLLCNFVEKYLGNIFTNSNLFHGKGVTNSSMVMASNTLSSQLRHQLAFQEGYLKRSTFKTKTVPSSKGWLHLLHMYLCGPMHVESINGKKYILVIVDDYSRYMWTHFLRSKDETPEVLIDFLKLIQRGLQAQVITVRTDRGTEFLNKTLHAYFKKEEIEH
ncbi:retrovirus-related pol polyprotein from transposon TNT 1-94 [Tanacetum coccineum]